jgi:hypothetical protein
MPIPSQFQVTPQTYHGSWCIPVTLSSITGAGDVVTEFTPGFPGRIVKFYWIQGVPVTTAGKAATLNLEVNAVDVVTKPGTNATIALTSAACTPLGKVIAGSTIGGSNTFDKDDTISVEATSVTAFLEGTGVLVVEYEGKVMQAI